MPSNPIMHALVLIGTAMLAVGAIFIGAIVLLLFLGLAVIAGLVFYMCGSGGCSAAPRRRLRRANRQVRRSTLRGNIGSCKNIPRLTTEPAIPGTD